MMNVRKILVLVGNAFTVHDDRNAIVRFDTCISSRIIPNIATVKAVLSDALQTGMLY